MTTNNIGLIGLGVMGRNLVLNLADNGYSVSVYNRSESKTIEFIQGEAAGKTGITAFYNIAKFINSIEQPRKVLLMVKAGESVDKVIDNIFNYLSPGDVIADLGNSNYQDTLRRQAHLEKVGINFAGIGVSGGEDGARRGPSIMPGGDSTARKLLEPIFLKISAEVKEVDGSIYKCCNWVGSGGAGHFVKMVHNGIEYGDMQIIAEVYNLMTANKSNSSFLLTNEEAAAVFEDWNSTTLEGYLNEITSKILRFKDTDNSYLIDKICDTAGQKGTGKWTVEEGCRFNHTVSVISEAVFARNLSSDRNIRETAAVELPFQTPDKVFEYASSHEIIEDLGAALLGARIMSYLQGFLLIKKASDFFRWDVNLVFLSEIWRGGCIIRSRLLEHIKNACSDENINELFINSGYFKKLLKSIEPGWRRTASRAVIWGCPAPGINSSLAYFDGIRSRRLPSNLIQAQRDFFGSHMYERIDKPLGSLFHTVWE